MRRAAILFAAASLAGPATAADRILCQNPAEAVEITLDVQFADADRTAGDLVAARMSSPHVSLSTDPATGGVETIAFSEIAFDRIEAGLESPDAGPMTLVVDIVRTARYNGDGTETDPVVAGVANAAGVGPLTLICTGW